MFKTPSNVVDKMCFWSFVKSHEITTDCDSEFLNKGAAAFLVSYKQTIWSEPQVAIYVESAFQVA